jgi:hypothetical protein
MSHRESLLACLDAGCKAEQALAASLSEKERSAKGCYEEWCFKDHMGHVAHWKEHLARRVSALARGEEPPPQIANYEQANADCFRTYCDRPWKDVRAVADQAHKQLVDAVRSASEELLAKVPEGSGDRVLWQDIVGTGYSHTLMHLADYYVKHGQPAEAGLLWQEWGTLVAPLDNRADWQGLVHYNAACGLALSGNPESAVPELRQALRLRPSMTTWSKQDSDLISLHKLPEFRELYAPEHWWKAIDRGPQAEASTDQWLRALGMLRGAIQAFPAEEWRKGDTPYQRPAALALHAIESMHGYTALNPGEAAEGGPFGVNWEDADSSKLPSQEELLKYLDQVERRQASFLSEADLGAPETQFRWTGATLLSRTVYSLRHVQHHVAEMCLELHRRGHKAPDWQ